MTQQPWPRTRDDVKQEIIRRLANGAVWARSFQANKPLLHELIEEGAVERCKPVGGRARNMVQLANGEREIDRFAEALSERGTIAAASRQLKISDAHGRNLFVRICADLGWQAA